MQLSSFKKTTISSKSNFVDSDSIYLLLPSNTSSIAKSIYDTGLLLSNCKGLISPNKLFKFFQKPFNARIHFLNLKKELIELKPTGKKLKVFSNIPQAQEDEENKNLVSNKQFFFYDLTFINEGVKTAQEKNLSEKRIFSFIFSELNVTYDKLKSLYPSKNIEIIFEVKDKSDIGYFFLTEFKRLRKVLGTEYNDHKLFDHFAFASTETKFFPVLEERELNNKSKSVECIQNRGEFLKALLDDKEIADEISDEKAIGKSDNDEKAKLPESLLTDIVKKLSDPSKVFEPTITSTPIKTLDTKTKKNNVVNAAEIEVNANPLKIKTSVSTDGTYSIDIDNKTLTKVLNAFQINNADIIINIKEAIAKYIEELGAVPSKETAEELVLKAVNYTVHGTDKVDDAYIKNPAALFNKLSQIDLYSVPLNIPDLPTLPFVPSEIINIDKTTGQHRQEYEFSTAIHTNIKKVFSALEKQPNHPIKVKKISWTLVNTDKDRYNDYTITLQNMDGNRDTYDIHLFIPAPVSNKYLKIGGNMYSFSSQQHLKVLTKTNKNDVRVLTNYAIIRLAVENLKFNVSDTKDIVDYCKQRYPELIESASLDSIKFADGDTIYLTGDQVYESAVRDISDFGQTVKPINRSSFLKELSLYSKESENKVENTSVSDLAFTEQYFSAEFQDELKSLIVSTPNGYDLDGFISLKWGDHKTNDSVIGLTNKLRSDGIFEKDIVLFKDNDFYYFWSPERKLYFSASIKTNTEEAVFNNVDTLLDYAMAGKRGFTSTNNQYTNLNVVIDEDTGKLVDKNTNTEFKSNRFEFIFDTILSKIQAVNPQDQLTKTKKSIPWISLYLSGMKIPFIIYLWQQKGLLSALNSIGIDYDISTERPEAGSIYIECTDNRYLVIRPNNIKERLVANGLFINKIKYPIGNLDDPQEINKHIIDNYGSRAIFNCNNITANLIDPVTKELLEFDGYPTNLPGLLVGPALTMLLNQAPSSLSDLSIYRARMSEIVLRILYKQLLRAHNSYQYKVEFGDLHAKLMLLPNFVINEFQSANGESTQEKTAGAALDLSSAVNPVEEIMLSSKVVKTGAGGLTSRREFSPSHRNITPSQYGNMSALCTPESATVGIITHHTLTPLIINEYGSYGRKSGSALDGFKSLAAAEALTPLINQINSDRGTLDSI